MPELPEVETVRRTIRPHVVGRRIEKVEVRERRLRRPVPSDLEERLRGRVIRDVLRRAKYLLLEIGGGECWAVHLGMSGRFCLGEPPPNLTHVHVRVRLESGVALYFRDPRRFGAMLLCRGEEDLGELGVEPLGREFRPDLLLGWRRRHPRRPVKALLMDSRKVAGIGNIYANEALFAAGIRPGRRLGRLRDRDLARLAESVPAVLRRAIARGGSSLSDYRDGQGQLGRFQEHFRVYGRAGLPCRECGTIIRRRVVAGRSSFFCPHCQR